MFRMFRILLPLVTTIFRCLHARRTLLLENLVLRQLAVLKRKHPRPRLRAFDKIFWVLALRFWSGWKRLIQRKRAFLDLIQNRQSERQLEDGLHRRPRVWIEVAIQY